MAEWTWLIALIGSLGAAAAATAAWKSARETRKTSLAQIVMQIMAIYSSTEMFDAMKNLRWHQEHTPDFAKKFGNETFNSVTIGTIDHNRRFIAHYFYRLRLLLETNLVDERFIRQVVTSDQVEFLLEIVEPLDKARNPDYDTSMYVAFRRMFPRVGPQPEGETHA